MPFPGRHRSPLSASSPRDTGSGTRTRARQRSSSSRSSKPTISSLPSSTHTAGPSVYRISTYSQRFPLCRDLQPRAQFRHTHRDISHWAFGEQTWPILLERHARKFKENRENSIFLVLFRHQSLQSAPHEHDSVPIGRLLSGAQLPDPREHSHAESELNWPRLCLYGRGT